MVYANKNKCFIYNGLNKNICFIYNVTFSKKKSLNVSKYKAILYFIVYALFLKKHETKIDKHLNSYFWFSASESYSLEKPLEVATVLWQGDGDRKHYLSVLFKSNVMWVVV